MGDYPLFLRVGGHTFNPRHIVRVHDQPDTVTIHLTPTSDRPDLIKLSGSDAAAFRQWVEANTGDVQERGSWSKDG